MSPARSLPPSIPATDYATSYSASPWTDPANGILTRADLQLLAHVNCGYLSSPRPPTLLALKQHAQSLAALIQRLSVSHPRAVLAHNPALSHNDRATARQVHEETEFIRHDAFDWLNDLRTPYVNEDETHHLPLKSLMNLVHGETDEYGVETHCPLKSLCIEEEGVKREKPFAAHQTLLMHANECLERLDHEYSATGGLMSVLPSAYDGDAEQLDAARNTLLGQWLLHHQDLVARLHELEINYTNALAVIEGRSAAPLHADTSAGATIASTTPLPQDELVVVGHRTHAYERIHALLDRAEAHVDSKQKLWWDRGVSGERTWMRDRGGDWYAQGLIPVDLEARFFRLKGKGRKGTLFMMPAVKQNAAQAHLLEMEARPTVVSVVTPKWAERATALEERLRRRTEGDGKGKAKAMMGGEGEDGKERIKALEDMVSVRDAELAHAYTAVGFYEMRVGLDAKQQMKELLEMVNMYKDKVKNLEGILAGEAEETQE